MESGNVAFGELAQSKPGDVLQQFVRLFADNGWLNQTMRIRHNGKNYRIMCSDKTFVACRLNDNSHLSSGIPGWIVCMVDDEQILEDSRLSGSKTDEPGVSDWLQYLNNRDFETL